MGPFPEECFKTGRLVPNFFTREKLLYQEASSDDRDNRHLSDEMVELIKQHR